MAAPLVPLPAFDVKYPFPPTDAVACVYLVPAGPPLAVFQAAVVRAGAKFERRW